MPSRIIVNKTCRRTIIPRNEIQSQDVLFGRGQFANNRRGNILYREVVAGYRSRYEEADKATKRKNLKKHRIAMDVVKKVKVQGGRFLMMYFNGSNSINASKNTQLWVVVNDNEASKKTKQAFRDIYKSDVYKHMSLTNTGKQLITRLQEKLEAECLNRFAKNGGNSKRRDGYNISPDSSQILLRHLASKVSISAELMRVHIYQQKQNGKIDMGKV